MTINENIYGAENTWVDYSTALTSIKVAKLNPNYMLSGDQYIYLAKNDIANNSIDLSFSPFGIGRDAAINKINFHAPFLNIFTKAYAETVFDACENVQRPAMPFLMNLYNTEGGLYTYYKWDKNAPNPNTSIKSSPVTTFDYQKLVILCYVQAMSVDEYADNTKNIVHNVLLDTYYNSESQYNYIDYPYISALFYVTYYTYDNGNTAPINFYSTPYFKVNAFDNLGPVLEKESLYLYNTFTVNNPSYYTCVLGSAPITVSKSLIADDSGDGGYLTFRQLANSTTKQLMPVILSTPNNFKYFESGGSVVIRPVYYNLPKEYVYKQFAFQGYWFTGNTNSISSIRGVNCTDPLLHLPVFDDNIYTIGEYASGEATSKLDNSKWGDPHKSNNYQPENNSNNLVTQLKYLTTYSASTSLYLITPLDYIAIMNFINTEIDYTVTRDTDWYGTDPADFIIGVFAYPFDVPDYTGNQDIIIGRANTNIQGKKALNSPLLNAGEVFLYPYYNDFRDYKPFSHYNIYIPFIGVYELDPSIFLNHNVRIGIQVDLNTCTCKVLIYRDDFIYDTMSSSIGVSLPVSAREQGSYINNMIVARASRNNQVADLALNSGKFILNASMFGASLATGNVVSSVATGASLANSAVSTWESANNLSAQKFILEHSTPKPVQISNSGGADSIVSDSLIRIIITRHEPLFDFNIYGNVYGFACLIADTLNNVHGYTICSSVRLNFNATREEYLMIYDYLIKGVVLP